MSETTAPTETAPLAERPRKTVSPTVAKHAITVYREFAKLAKEETVNEAVQLVFRGSIADTYKLAKISNAHYSKIFRVLEDCGAYTILTKGGKDTESVIALNGEPVEHELVVFTTHDLTGRGKTDKVLNKVLILEAMLGGVNVKAAVQNLDNRLKALEAQRAQEG